MSKSSTELGLHSFMYGLHRFKNGWNSVKLLLISRFLLESPSPFLALPDSLADKAGFGPDMLHSKQSISFLIQIFHSQYVQSHEMVRQDSRLGNPDVLESWYASLSLGQIKCHSTQGRRQSRSLSIARRLIPTPLLHLSLSTRPGRGYRNHCVLPLQRCPPP